jgi:uncharacterized protein YyaL (SSP411 family)
MKNLLKDWRVLVGTGLALVIIALIVPYVGSPHLRAARAGGNYLINHLYADGSFVYEYDPLTRTESNAYNMLRHAGTAYSLFELYGATGSERYAEAGEHALTYLDAQLVPCPTVAAALCVLENNEIKLGGNGLAVLAMATEIHTTQNATRLSTAQALAEYIVGTQSASGEFRAHKTDGDGVVSDFISGYYPGEAIFALARLYAIDGNERWIDSAHRGAEWLITVRDAGKDIDELEHDHWLLYGLRELYAHTPNELYLEHARTLTDAIADAQHPSTSSGQVQENPDWAGGFYNPPRSTPTATRSEGLSAAYDIFVMAGDTEYAQRAYETMERAVAFQLQTQFSRRDLSRLDTDPRAAGGFHESLTEYTIRIDYVQHNISALLAFDRIKKSL